MTTSHQSHTPAAEEHFDLIIIGTGSGNSIPSPDFDDQKIAIIEKGTFGGTCLNVGCIPSKALLKNAELAHTLTHEKDKYGIDDDSFLGDQILGGTDQNTFSAIVKAHF